MGTHASSISPEDLTGLIGSDRCPLIVDVRRPQAYAEAERVIPTAVWRDPGLVAAWAKPLPPEVSTVVYCVHGHQVSQSVAAFLRANGHRASFLTGGFAAYGAGHGPTILKSALPGRHEDRPSRWVTRERPKIDRIACPWFIGRFVDRDAAVIFVAAEWVEAAASPDDQAMLARGLPLYDALFAWCRSAVDEAHGWPPKA